MDYTPYNAKNNDPFSRYSIYRRNAGPDRIWQGLLETLICDWINYGCFNTKPKPHKVDGIAEKCRRLAIREAERVGYTRVAELSKKNNTWGAFRAFCMKWESDLTAVINAERKAAREARRAEKEARAAAYIKRLESRLAR